MVECCQIEAVEGRIGALSIFNLPIYQCGFTSASRGFGQRERQ
jgi:hypothetical protein